jgi:hypothetical protein
MQWIVKNLSLKVFNQPCFLCPYIVVSIISENACLLFISARPLLLKLLNILLRKQKFHHLQKVATSAIIIFDCDWRFTDEVIKEFKLLIFYSC